MGLLFFPKRSKTTVKNGLGNCMSCSNAQTQCHKSGIGEGQKGIVILIDKAFSTTQIISNENKAFLSQQLKTLDINLMQDCVIIPTILASKAKGHKFSKTINDKDVALCREKVAELIARANPHIIIAIGVNAMKHICKHRAQWEKGFPSIDSWRGYTIPDQDLGCFVIPTYELYKIVPHSADGIKDRGEKELLLRYFEKDLAQVVEVLKRPFLQLADKSHIRIPKNEKDAILELTEAIEYIEEHKPLVSFDYETTGIKPFLEGHKIVSCAITYGEDRTLAYRWTPKTTKLTLRILTNPTIRKTGHNIKFEELWTRTIEKEQVHGWYIDTMLSSHILDNRKGIKSLKMQGYLRLGIIGYEADIKQYIESKNGNKGKNDLNEMDKAPTNTLLLYNGYDAFCGWHIAKIHEKELTDFDLWDGYTLFHNGALALVDAEENGLLLDADYCKAEEIKMDMDVENIMEKIMKYPVVAEWAKESGVSFNLASNKQLTDVVYNKLETQVKATTKSGAPSVSKATLEGLGIPFIEDLIHIRKIKKIKDTYLKGFVREETYGIVHPFYHLHDIISYRSSSSDPNFQNIPKRDKEAQKLIRRAFLPRKDHCFVEIDYSGIEVRIGAAYHRDKNMIRYICDESNDMHRDTAADLFLLSSDQVTKALRQSAKTFVFAQFYGDWYKSCAENQWDECITQPSYLLEDGTHIKDWLAEHGIQELGKLEKNDKGFLEPTPNSFMAHCKRVEEIMWKTRFPQYAKWRKQQWIDYQDTLEFRSFTGFRYSSVMGRKEVTNYGTQGSAFHCLLWSFTQLAKWLKATNKKSLALGQIHDAIILNIHKDELNEVLNMARDIMINKLTDTFKWINVPLDVEADVAPINKSWYDVKNAIHRPVPCSCGIEWGYKEKAEDNSFNKWVCPICAKQTILEKTS